MNKRFSTLLAAALVAGSFSSAFAQLEGRNVEWKDAQASRAYYLAGVHFVSPTDYLQAFSLQGLVNGADITAANPVAAAQWTVETKKVGTVTHYAFKNIEGEQYLAFEKKDGAYALAAKKEANDETKSFRWFTVAANGNLQAVLSDEKEPYFLGLKNDGTADWSLALLQSSEHHTDGSTSVIKKKVALYEIYNDQITAEAFASKFGENFTIEFPETLDDMDVFENVSVEKIANDNLGFKLVDNKGTKDTKDDEYVVLANERVSNSELAANAIGYRYAKMTAKAIKDKKIDDKNTVFYAEENETNIGDGKYALVQKVKVGDLDNKDVTFGKVTNDETTRQLASVEYDCHSTFMGVTVGKGTRVANTEVANERMLIVNVTAKVADKKNSSALGLKNDFTGARWYDKVSEADFDQPQGQWLVAAGSAANTIKLINVQKPGFVQDNIRLYEAEGENTYTVFASDLGLSGLETITLTKVEDYDKLNGYYSTLSDINQKFAFVTTGEYANEEAGSDLYLKAGVEGDVVKEPFVIINADDYYGKEAFSKLHEFLLSGNTDADKINLAMAGFSLKNTLSENGAVTRGVCVADEAGFLKEVVETTGIQCVDGKIQCDNAKVSKWITPDTMVSMNMWAGYPDFLRYIDEGFARFLDALGENPEKKEYLLPNIVAELLEKKLASVKVLNTPDRWIGITYKEDIEPAQEGFRQMIESGLYPENLWD